MATTTKRVEKTTTVRITRALADRIAERFESRPLSELYAEIEPWVKKTTARAMKLMIDGKQLDRDKPEDKRDYSGTVRILKSQVARLKVAAPLLGHTISEMVEDKLRKVLA